MPITYVTAISTTTPSASSNRENLCTSSPSEDQVGMPNSTTGRRHNASDQLSSELFLPVNIAIQFNVKMSEPLLLLTPDGTIETF